VVDARPSKASPAAAAPATASPAAAVAPSSGTTPTAGARAQDPPFVSTPEPRERPADQPRGSALGMPKALHDAREEGLWIWHDERGSEWHLRTGARSNGRHFSGRLWLGEGTFADVRPNRTEWSDRLRATGRAIEFDFRTQGSPDGFEFRVSGARCVHFSLSMDGRNDTSGIYIGASGSHPSRHTFTLCP
jgi:hypothetical protein